MPRDLLGIETRAHQIGKEDSYGEQRDSSPAPSGA
jgi:hypothetical protein